MAYQALYRKYRPKSFDDVLGQDAIVKTLKSQITSGRISHAYLFCGTRGTGKTSVAKIFAKSVNCQNPSDGSPCGKCISCENIQNDLDMNILEIDAASNNGVDNIRDIRDEVRYTPVDGIFKVYIIDEVHMLSTGAFNALLKTLEEPPKHVIFLLATTDPQKIPPTVLSRCQRFDFKRIPQTVLITGLTKIAEVEGVLADDDALCYIAQISDGAFRDAESILDQCISFYAGEVITLQKVLDVVGAVSDTLYFDLTNAVADFDTEKCMSIVSEVIGAGKDMHQFVLSFIQHLRNLLLVSVSQSIDVLDMSKESAARYLSLSCLLRPERISQLIRQFSEMTSQMRYSQNPRVLLEVALIKTCNPVLDESYDGLLSRMAIIEKNLNDAINAKAIQTPVVNQTAEPMHSEEAVQNTQSIPKLHDSEITKIWDGVKTTFSGGTDAIIAQTTAHCSEKGVLNIICPNEVYAEYINKKRIPIIKEALQKETGIEYQVQAVCKSLYEVSQNSKNSSADSYSLLTKQLQDAGIEFTETE